MNNTLRTLMAVAGLAAATQAAAQVTFYERPGFNGQSFTTERPVANLQRFGFNDRASSAVVNDGRWQVCEDARFDGRCVVLERGEYPNLRAMGLNNQISSVRMVGPDRVARDANDERHGYATHDAQYRRHRGERLFTVPVSAVHAVVTQQNQHCWVERQQVQNGGDPNAGIAGAVVGGVLGGIIGHQFGGGRGNDVATGAGAVGGALLGSNVARNNSGGEVATQDVQRCERVSGHARPDYWDVTYNYRGVEHHVQMTSPPGDTITVNADGEPRV